MTLSSVLLVFALVAPCRSLVTVPRAVRRPSTVRLEAAPLLECKGIEAKVTEVNKQILKGLDLTVNAGEVHAIMGPNGASSNTSPPARRARRPPPSRRPSRGARLAAGSGKSTLSKVLSRHPAYEVLGGSAKLNGVELLEMEAEEAAKAGVFLAFQYPVELPGVGNTDFLRLMLNAKRTAEGLPELDPLEFLGVAMDKCKIVQMNPDFLSRNVNEGFSGGEKKRNEILQMARPSVPTKEIAPLRARAPRAARGPFSTSSSNPAGHVGADARDPR